MRQLAKWSSQRAGHPHNFWRRFRTRDLQKRHAHHGQQLRPQRLWYSLHDCVFLPDGPLVWVVANVHVDKWTYIRCCPVSGLTNLYYLVVLPWRQLVHHEPENPLENFRWRRKGGLITTGNHPQNPELSHGWTREKPKDGIHTFCRRAILYRLMVGRFTAGFHLELPLGAAIDQTWNWKSLHLQSTCPTAIRSTWSKLHHEKLPRQTIQIHQGRKHTFRKQKLPCL